MGAIFGTDGIRGVVGEDLTYNMAISCGNAIARIKPGVKILIGQDTRCSGVLLSQSVALGAELGGADVTYIGVASTPCVSYLTNSGDYDFGVVISASHNPPQYNGIKVFGKNGQKLSDELEILLERGLVRSISDIDSDKGTIAIKPQLKKDYFDFLYNCGCKLKGLKIVLDCGNGSGKEGAVKVFRRLGAQVVLTGASSDGSKINKDCGATHTDNLSKKILQHNADFGFSFDGDADRIIAADADGNIYNGDNILLCLARSMQECGGLSSKYVVGTSLSNMGLEKELKSLGLKLVRADVGDKYVIAKMRYMGANLGGEQSGHIIVSDKLPTGDGVLVAVLLSSIVAQSNKSFKELMAFKPMPQCMINVKVADKVRAMGSEALAEAISEANNKLAGLGRVLVRPSGTEQLVRVMVECEDSNLAYTLADFIARKIPFKGE